MSTPRSVNLAALSLTWREAPTAVRDLAAAPLSTADWEGLKGQGLRGLVEIHTCARSTWLMTADDADWAAALLQSRLLTRLLEAGSPAVPRLWVGESALRYVLRVSVGLDSLMEGEADVGGQVNDGFAAAAAAGRVCTGLKSAWRAAVDLTGEARRAGLLRPGRGLGHLAVDTLKARGVGPDTVVGVVGAGHIARQTIASLGRAGFVPPLVYNRTPRDGALPLAAAVDASHLAYVVCTAAPQAWFTPPAAARVVIDLGRPAQVAGEALGLDALLAGLGLRLPDEDRLRLETLVESAVGHCHTRQRLHASQHVLARVHAVRNRFVNDQVEELLGTALDTLDAPTRKRVLLATRQVVRQYSREVIDALKETVG